MALHGSNVLGISPKGEGVELEEGDDSALVRSHLQCCVQAWDPQHRNDVALLEQVIGGLEHLS